MGKRPRADAAAHDGLNEMVVKIDESWQDNGPCGIHDGRIGISELLADCNDGVPGDEAHPRFDRVPSRPSLTWGPP